MTYVPAMVFIGKYTLGDIQLPIPVIIGVQALMFLFVFILSELLYHTAMKRFTAVGA
jgi:ABC-type uncharacterized transport system permease subunit